MSSAPNLGVPTLTIETAGSDGYLIRFSYDADFVEDLKTILPPHARKWDSRRQAWWIDQVWLDGVLQLAEPHFVILDRRVARG